MSQLYRYRPIPVGKLCTNEGYMLVALETYIIFEWSLVTSLARVRELQRAAFATFTRHFAGCQ